MNYFADCENQSAFCIQNMVILVQNIFLLTLVYACAVFDIKSYTIPNSLIIIGVVISALFLIVRCSQKGFFYGIRYLIGSFFVLLLMFLVAVVSKGSLGGGDVKLVTVICLFIGLSKTLICVLLACVIGIFVFVLSYITKRYISKIPFVPGVLLSLWYILCIDNGVV